MAIAKEELEEISAKLGKETSDKIKADVDRVEKTLSDKLDLVEKGLMKQTDFESFKTEQLAPVNDTLKKLEAAMKEQGNKITSVLEKGAPNSISLESFISEKAEKIKDLKVKGGYMEFTGEELKAAGVYSIAGAIPTASAYAPGLGGPQLEIFDIARNPNFITSKVNLGRTNQSILAWANEIDWYNITNGGGVAGLVNEGALKPQTQHRFSVETSKAKKVAGWVELTDEFDQDLPGFATNVRRMLNNDVVRAYDDAIQTDVQTAARGYLITGLDDKIALANYWDSLNAMAAQVGTFNFTPNTYAYNYITKAIVEGQKTTQGDYLFPTFAERMLNDTVYANKMANYFALVGDLMQYNVDIYKDFVLKVGWINDEFVNNKFAIVGEMRYHSYISDARKNALVYANLDTVTAQILKPAA